MTKRSGKCLCGAVTFTATPKSDSVGVCHCGMCRTFAAGPFFVVDCVDTLKIDNDADLGVYQSSDYGERGFCKKCGSSLFWRMRDGSSSHVSANAFQGAVDWNFDHEIFVEDQPAYYSFAQKTHRMTGEELFKQHQETQGGA